MIILTTKFRRALCVELLKRTGADIRTQTKNIHNLLLFYRLESQLQLMHMGKLPVSGGEQLVSLFEDLHWILMITGKHTYIEYTCI